MFNDLNNSTNQNRQVVDDIFAETDKPQEGAATPAPAAPRPAGAEIDTQRIGLAATDELSENAPEKRSQDKLFKIIIAIIAVAVLGLGGYLVYSKFFNTAPVETGNTVATTTKKTDVSQTAAPVATTPVGSFVETAGTVAATTTESATTPIIPGVNAPAATTTVTATSTAAALVDSDGDGLTDAEERIAGTNINIIDTDNDGLSDYEEVKIYKTNPLSADTDGDGYLDGAEVKSGYNPNGAGKLSDAAKATSTIK